MRRLVCSLVALGAMVSGAQDAWSEAGTHAEALEKAPLRLLNVSDDSAVMAQNSPITSRPDRPLDIWMWQFRRNPVITAGVLRFDTTAARYTVDCNAGTQVVTDTRAYLFGRLVENPGASVTKAQSSTAELAAKVVCEPGFNADAARYQDPKAAKAAANKLFAERDARRQAEAQSRGPFRVIRTYDDMLLMAEGAAPTQKPTAPTSLKWWAFLAKPQVADGVAVADALATTYRVDCSTNALQQEKLELYLDGRIRTVVNGVETAKNADSAADKLLTRAACDPAFEADAQVFPDFNSARSATANHFKTKDAAASDEESDVLRADGPFRIVSSGARAIHTLTGPPPEDTPQTPIERWNLSFFQQVGNQVGIRFDSHATLIRFDCAAKTIEGLKREYFLDGKFVKAEPISSPPDRTKEGTLGHAFLRASCEPDYGNQPHYLVDYQVARRIAVEAFGQKEVVSTKPQAPVSPKTGSARAKQPIRHTGPDDETSEEVILMSEGPAPKARPQRPVDIWTWTFKSKTAMAKQQSRSNTDALLLRVDCHAGTQQILAAEYYADGKLVEEVDYVAAPPSDPSIVLPRKAPQWVVKAACDPEYKTDARVFPNRQAAQAAAGLMMFDRRLKKLSKSVRDISPAEIEPLAGEGARAGGPLRVIGRNASTRSFFMAVGAAPKVKPAQPREIWIWEFTQKARALDGKAPYDTWATRIRVDCIARTVRPQLREGYRDGRLQASWELTGKPRKPAGKNLDAFVFSAACQPGFAADGQTFRDHQAARAAASRTKF